MEIVNSNIKLYRKRRQMTLKEVAQELDVSISFLSQIENGKAMPSLATLKKIADALNTTIGVLVGEDKAASKNPIVREKERRSIKEIGSGLKIEMLATQDPNMQLEPVLFTFAENGSTGDFSQHFGQEFVFVISGSLEINLDGKKYILNKGDSIYFDSYRPHFFHNRNNGVTRAIRIITPPLYFTDR